jgi:hypothetical protein
MQRLDLRLIAEYDAPRQTSHNKPVAWTMEQGNTTSTFLLGS